MHEVSRNTILQIATPSRTMNPETYGYTKKITAWYRPSGVVVTH